LLHLAADHPSKHQGRWDAKQPAACLEHKNAAVGPLDTSTKTSSSVSPVPPGGCQVLWAEIRDRWFDAAPFLFLPQVGRGGHPRYRCRRPSPGASLFCPMGGGGGGWNFDMIDYAGRFLDDGFHGRSIFQERKKKGFRVEKGAVSDERGNIKFVKSNTPYHRALAHGDKELPMTFRLRLLPFSPDAVRQHGLTSQAST